MLLVEDKERDLKRLENAPPADVERQQLRQQIMMLTKKRVQIVQEYMVYLFATRMSHILKSISRN